jgi:NDP-sugar pyrophosphorylase family protein
VSDTPPRPNGDAGPWPAMVLTAGLGSRLAPLSGLRAKPALPVAGVPLVGRILRWLAAGGVRRAVLNLHHLPDTITAAVGDGQAFGVRVDYSREQVVLGRAGGPARALPLVGADRFFLVNGDTLTNLHLEALAARHRASGAAVTLALIPNPDPNHYGGVCVDEDGCVTGFAPPGPDNRGWHFIGVQAVEAAVFATVDPDTPSDTFNGVYREMIARERGIIRAFTSGASFQDIGTAADYLATCLAVARAEGLGDTLVGRRSSIDRGARVSRSVLWDDVRVGDGAALDWCVIADGVTVPPGARLDGCVIIPGRGRGADPGESWLGGLLVSPLGSRRRE